MSVAIEISNVNKAFKNTIASNDLSLKIYEGEYVALLGPNGAGKTTLVEMIEGIQRPDSGTIRLFGKSWQENEMELRHSLGFSLQETRFIDKLTTLETLELFGTFYKIKKQRCFELLELTGLIEKKDTYTVNLSGGQRQKLALCIALSHSPKILILDEPTTGLDPSARKDIWDIVLKLKTNKTTLILTTHYLEEAEFLCERIFILDKGKFIAQGTLNQLLEERGMHEIIEFKVDKPVQTEELKLIPGVHKQKWNEETKSGVLFIDTIVETLPKLLEFIQKKQFNLLELECRKLNLNDLFLSMTGRKLDE